MGQLFQKIEMVDMYIEPNSSDLAAPYIFELQQNLYVEIKNPQWAKSKYNNDYVERG